METDRHSDIWTVDPRVEVFRDYQMLLLKPQDITVPRLARVFKIKPQTLYLEEDITKHAEFPEEGKFNLPALHGNRYKICGDLDDAPTPEESLPTTPSVLSHYVQSTSLPGASTRNWSIPQPWMSSGTIARKPFSSTTNPLMGKRPVNQAYETFLKKSIPFVTLSLEGKNITTDSTNDNVYIRIPENSVSVLSILSEIEPKLSLQQDDLVLLDSKFIPVSDDKDMEYWKTPSRCFYVVRRSEYDELLKQKEKRRLSLNKKRKMVTVDLTDEEDVKHPGFARMESNIETVMQEISQIKASVNVIQTDLMDQEQRMKAEAIQPVLQYLECKICKDIPTPPVILLLCCSQILGCEVCLENCMDANESCSLCRTANPNTVQIHGQDDLYNLLRQQRPSTSNL